MKHIALKKQRGATLIEALVSILVMSLGLLGLASLQMTALAYQKSSWATQRIVTLTTDISERIRANDTGSRDGHYTYTQPYATAQSATITSNGCRNSAATCTVQQIASDDLSEWLVKAQTTLPGGAVRLEGSKAAGYTITAMYLDKEFTSAPGVLQSAPTCTAATTGFEWRNCCPAAVAAPAGVRCSRSFVIP